MRNAQLFVWRTMLALLLNIGLIMEERILSPPDIVCSKITPIKEDVTELSLIMIYMLRTVSVKNMPYRGQFKPE